MIKLPFGKYKGIPVQDLLDEDMDYFIWLTTIELRGKLKEEVDKLKEEFKDEIKAHELDIYKDGYEDGMEYTDPHDDYKTMDDNWRWK